MSFTDRMPFTVSLEDTKRKWGSGFSCKLCGLKFKEGHAVRWIYANGTPGMPTGNFFVCSNCDGPDELCMKRGKESYELAVKLAKQWGIYGPDWEDRQQFMRAQE